MNDKLNFITPPISNLKISIGADTNMYFHYHAKKVPNRFQRWMLQKFMGIKMEVIGEKK